METQLRVHGQWEIIDGSATAPTLCFGPTQHQRTPESSKPGSSGSSMQGGGTTEDQSHCLQRKRVRRVPESRMPTRKGRRASRRVTSRRSRRASATTVKRRVTMRETVAVPRSRRRRSRTKQEARMSATIRADRPLIIRPRRTLP
jgi:hypothetical protein